MKKLIFLILFAAVLSAFTSTIYAEGNTLLYFKGDTFNLSNAVLIQNNEYFLDAESIRASLGMSYSIDGDKKTIYINFNGIIGSFLIANKPSALYSLPSSAQMLPVYINGKLYFPFKFFEYFYNQIIKYNKDMDILYMIDESASSDLSASEFINYVHDFNIKLKDSFIVNIGGSDYNYQGSPIYITDKDNLFTAEINSDRLNDISIKAMREYYGDYTSSEHEMFNKIASYKESYFRATQEYYRNEYLYGGGDAAASGSNMKVFGSYDETLYGQPARVFMYNILNNSKSGSEENTYIAILLPVFSNRTIYSIDIKIPKGTLNEDALDRIEKLLNSIKISDLPEQTEALALLSDTASVNHANAGIYAALSQDTLEYVEYENAKLGYAITYPVSFIPFMQNNIIDDYDYKSYTIDENTYFHISAEPLSQSGSAVQSKIDMLKNIYGSSMSLSGTGTLVLGEKQYEYAQYKYIDEDYTVYVNDYFIKNDSMLYNIQLSSHFKQPSQEVMDELNKILGSLTFIERSEPSGSQSSDMIKFTDEASDFAFNMPNTWLIANRGSVDGKYGQYTLENPDFSGPTNFTISVGELQSGLKTADILKALVNIDEDVNEDLIKSYNPPYTGMPSRLLLTDYYIKDDTLYIYKLVNYLDHNNRSQVCYVEDIVSGESIYSIFITASDYAVSNGEIVNDSLNRDINAIYHSFSLVTGEGAGDAGDTTDDITADIIQYFKTNYGEFASLTSLEFTDASRSHAIAEVDGISDSGYYLMKLPDAQQNNSAAHEILVLNFLSKSEITYLAARELISRNVDKPVSDIAVNRNTMSLDVVYEDKVSSSLKASYNIDINASDNALYWKLTRVPGDESFLERCKSFVENYVNGSVKIYYPPDFDISGSDTIADSFLLYAEFGSSQGYFIIREDIQSSTFNLVQFIPMEYVWDMVKNDCAKSDSGYTPINYSLNSSNKFELKIFLLSNSGAFKTQKLYISINAQNGNLDLSIKAE